MREIFSQDLPLQVVSKARLNTEFGLFTAIIYRAGEIEHMALVMGDHLQLPLVRVHSECLTGDLFGSTRCDCGEQLRLALRKISKEGAGIFIYLRGHEGRGIGLGDKIHAYFLQDQGLDTVEANEAMGLPVDARNYRMAAQILAHLQCTKIRLLTNNPSKYDELRSCGIDIVERISLVPRVTEENLFYLRTKAKKMGHLLEV